MNYWIFKCSPEKYDIDERIKDREPRITWLVSRYKDKINKGDIASDPKGFGRKTKASRSGKALHLSISSYPGRNKWDRGETMSRPRAPRQH